MPMRSVYLHGHLKREFGESFRFDIETAGEAIRALNCAFPGRFLMAIKEGSYQLIRGRRRGGMNITLDRLNDFRLGSADLHIVPLPAGSKSARGGATTKIIVGTALAGAAIFLSGGALAAPLAGQFGAALGITYGQVAMLGLGVALAGVASAYAQPETPQSADTDKANSYAFRGPANVNEQGTGVPLIYGGPIVVGSQAISAGMDIENVGAYQS